MSSEHDEQPRPVDLNRRRLLLTAGSLAVAGAFAGITADRVKGNDGPAGPRIATTGATSTGSTSSAPTSTTATTSASTSGTATTSTSAATSASATGAPAGEGKSLDEAVKAAIGGRSGVGVAVFDKRTGKTYSYQGGWLNETASIVKVMILSSALRKARAGGAELSRSRKAQAKLSITQSDNAASNALYRYGGGRAGIVAVAREVGMTATADAPGSTSWGRTQTSAGDQVALIRAMAYGGTDVLVEEDRAFLWDLMGDVVPGQRWGVGHVEKFGATAHLKNGWVTLRPDNRWRINTIGQVSGPGGRDYVLAILSEGHRSQGAGMTFVNGISEAVYGSLAAPYEG